MKLNKDILKKIRKYEIKIRHAVNTAVQGNFNSVFKGNGLEFDDVREYQYGDDIRTINWNVTAKGHGVFINTYKEDKTQNVFLMVDVSASGKVGRKNKRKIDLANELTSVLAFSAAIEQSDVGLISFSDKKERFLKPGKGEKHAFAIFSSLYKDKPQSLKTDLKKFFEYARTHIRKKSILIIISDFIDDDYQDALKALSYSHDVLLIHIFDKQEGYMPNIGISPLWDLENKKFIWKNTFSPSFRKNYKEDFDEIQNSLKEISRKQKMSYLKIQTDTDYVDNLVDLFKMRNKRR